MQIYNAGDNMISIGKKNILTISVEDYEFPVANSIWDDFLNLNIEYSVEDKVVFKYTDPCITTNELKALAITLDKFAVSDEKEVGIRFVEPIIAISVFKDIIESITYLLEIQVNFNCGDNDVLRKFRRLNQEEYLQFVDAIKKESEKFPPRCN